MMARRHVVGCLASIVLYCCVPIRATCNEDNQDTTAFFDTPSSNFNVTTQGSAFPRAASSSAITSTGTTYQSQRRKLSTESKFYWSIVYTILFGSAITSIVSILYFCAIPFVPCLSRRRPYHYDDDDTEAVVGPLYSSNWWWWCGSCFVTSSDKTMSTDTTSNADAASELEDPCHCSSSSNNDGYHQRRDTNEDNPSYVCTTMVCHDQNRKRCIEMWNEIESNDVTCSKKIKNEIHFTTGTFCHVDNCGTEVVSIPSIPIPQTTWNHPRDDDDHTILVDVYGHYELRSNLNDDTIH
jgi:hypothetical protein